MAIEARLWNIQVSEKTDQAIRSFLASEDRDGDLSRFVEDAVEAYLFDMAAERAKSVNENVSAKEIENQVEEALLWARRS